jgi:hypothetical protein
MNLSFPFLSKKCFCYAAEINAETLIRAEVVYFAKSKKYFLKKSLEFSHVDTNFQNYRIRLSAV